jgi:hypothetical protein
MLYDLYFLDSYDRKRLVKKKVEEDKLVKNMIDYAQALNPNFKVYYVRSWKTNKNTTMYDIGSHSEFFLAEEIDNGDS